jgi:hypothetical protein
MGARRSADSDAYPDANADTHSDSVADTRLFGHRARVWLGLCERRLGARLRYSRWRWQHVLG